MAKMQCPKCTDSVLKINYLRGIEIDHCAICGGIWLDRNELTTLVRVSKDHYDDIKELENSNLATKIDSLDAPIDYPHQNSKGTLEDIFDLVNDTSNSSNSNHITSSSNKKSSES